nr:helix-turn-helix transcriptional regulator [Dactylosporangium thailandense]
MSDGPDPALARRRLMLTLRGFRSGAGATQTEVAADMEWSQSKVVRVENGEVGISATDLRALLSFYGVTDHDTIDELLALARAARKQPFAPFADVLSGDFKRYLGYEAAAQTVYHFELSVIPGLLQTAAYTRAVIQMYNPDEPEPRRRKREELKAKRRELLDRDERPELWFILDEGALRRLVGAEAGSPALMLEQLDHIVALAERPRCHVQVVRFDAGAHPGMAGPFAVLEFADSSDERILYLENANGDVTIRDATELTARYLDVFRELQDRATPPGKLRDVMSEIKAALVADAEAARR